jgi:O-antigen/teichoic acid export membrane protein
MLAGTGLTIVLNILLIPRLGLVGAVIAAMASVAVVIIFCAAGLRQSFLLAVMVGAVIRLAAALAATGAVILGVERLGVAPWLVALAACGTYPVFAIAAGLLTHPARSAFQAEVRAPP